MKLIIRNLFALCLFVPAQLTAQTSRKALLIGDAVPNIKVDNVINYPQSSFSFNDLKGKFIILDFWATWCSPCIAAFPKLDSLQRKFGDAIQILPVTSEQSGMVKSFIQKMAAIKKVNPPTVTGDSILQKLFRHTSLPHYVWIDGNGKILAFTDSDEVTESNISNAIAGRPVKFKMKNDYEQKVLYSTNSPTFAPSITVQDDNGISVAKLEDSNLKFFTAITGYVEGLSQGFNAYQKTLLTARNQSIRSLYKLALLKNSLRMVNSYTGSLKIEVPDSALYYKITSIDLDLPRLEYLAWARENTYCYDIKVPDEMADRKFDIMLSDLNRYFGMKYNIEGVLEKRNTKYLSLQLAGSTELLASKGGKPIVKVDKFSLTIRNSKVSSLLSSLAQPLQLQPFIIDETGYTGNIDIDINCQLGNLDALNAELKKFGLQLVEQEKIMDIPLIRLKSTK